jgi:taurine dioxygenase
LGTSFPWTISPRARRESADGTSHRAQASGHKREDPLRQHIYDYRRKYPATEGAQYKTTAAELLLYLLKQSQIPEYQMRLHWSPNTVVMWDNYATQHYALSDYYPAVRRMARTTILAD